MDANVLSEVVRSIIDIIGLSMAGLCIYIGVYHARRYMLNYWVKKAVSAAEITFLPGQVKEKKEWVQNFLNANDLKNGLSDEVVDLLIEAAVNDMNIQQGKSKPKSSSVKKTKLND